VTRLCFSPAGVYVLSASYDCDVILWDTRKRGGLVKRFKGEDDDDDDDDDVDDAAAAAADMIIMMMMPLIMATFMITMMMMILTSPSGHRDHVLGLSWHESGKMFASCSHDKTILLWRTDHAAPILVLEGHDSIVYACRHIPESNR
jgi:WD40 repeat protein